MKFENIYREVDENMRLALLSLWAPGNHPLRPALEDLFKREPLLAEPVFQSSFGWEMTKDAGWRDYLDQNVFNNIEAVRERAANEAGKPFRPFVPFKHQAESWKALKEGRSIVVTSGTGSGKTECFMYPVMSDLYNMGRNNAIEAIFLYPLNALMEDQKKRLNDLCLATGLHFAVYNGNTPEYHENGRTEKMSNEIATRDEIRDTKHAGTRPEILLTNPSMLEYILVRKKDQEMLQESAGKLRWIVIDEAHSYSGSAAVELAYQIKRVLEAFEMEPGQVRFACTSATIGDAAGAQSLAEFISTITGQPKSQIQIIGGNRLVKPLDESLLSDELSKNGLPATEKVLTLRKKINEVAGITLQQAWEWLNPDKPYDKGNPLPALKQLDQLCEMYQGDIPVLSLRAHFFVRSITGLYACANEKCSGANKERSIYGRLTTVKSTVCPECDAPLLEIVQCKRCNGFVLMGSSDSQTHVITPCEESTKMDDYFTIDLPPEQEEEDAENSSGEANTFFLLPYEKEKFFNPVGKAVAETLVIEHRPTESTLEVVDDTPKETAATRRKLWVEVKKDDHSYCPCCGRPAMGSRLNLKHFRIPIRFINQTISPVLLRECALPDHSWGKYIAFTDSRQGTAISAKTFNINVERNQSFKSILQKLAEPSSSGIDESVRAFMSEEQWEKYIAQKGGQSKELSLYDVSNCIYNDIIFRHIKTSDDHKRAYKAALMRTIIGRRPQYETNAETMGLITLVYPALKNVRMSSNLADFVEEKGLCLTDQDWRDFLKICLDYFIRFNNHIQPLIDDERKYVRDSNLSTPVAGPDDPNPNAKQWPSVNVKQDGTVSHRQTRLVVLLCAGLGVHTLDALQEYHLKIDRILRDAWDVLVEKRILTRVKHDDTDGYNHPIYYKDGKYVGCYYLNLSGEDGNDVCKVRRNEKSWLCPVTHTIIDTLFCGYSPMMIGELSEKMVETYKCVDTVEPPSRPRYDDEVPQWLLTDSKVQAMKVKGLWTDRHKYIYKCTPAYIAAEHSAQQSKELLREYTRLFSQKNPAINVLHCSTTMEMGVDIGDIDTVLMDTIPPTAANYLQRVGRAGRMGQSKALAFSLCNNTPVGLHAFANPMWALETTNHMAKVMPSQTIIQRHINSYFFRHFICGNGEGIEATISVDEFMTTTCDTFVQYLDDMSTNQVEKNKFHDVFGQNANYTINITREEITRIREKYDKVIEELRMAFDQFQHDEKRKLAITKQIRRLKEENLLKYLSENQFIPNANMPTGVVTFDFMDKDQAKEYSRLINKEKKLREKIEVETAEDALYVLKMELQETRKKINRINSDTTASRDIITALNEYAPEQTVVVNEKNFVSAGVKLFGVYRDETQSRAIYHCFGCGRTLYKANLTEGLSCGCGQPFRSILNKRGSSYTRAYEPVGFRTDQNADSSREERTEKRYFDIRPVLLETDWNRHVDINMCEMTSSGETGRILFFNAGDKHGFAFCKRCGRAAVEYATNASESNIPRDVMPGHQQLWGGDCDANAGDIARNVVFTGYHPTCYVVMRFKQDNISSTYENDEQLAYSLGVVIKRALAKHIGVDEGELGFGIKQDIFGWVLFIYDTARGGCGYALRLTNAQTCQKVLDIARKELEESKCDCQIKGGACPRCLVDRNNFRDQHLLSKAKALDWLNRQKNKTPEMSPTVKEACPNAKMVLQPLKNIVKEAVVDKNVTEIILCVSDNTDDTAIHDWISIQSEMGKYINRAIAYGKKVSLMVEYHPELHSSLGDKLPFINLKDKFADCKVSLVKDMGKIKTAVIVKVLGKTIRYFTDKEDALSFSNKWGAEYSYAYTDDSIPTFSAQEEPTYTYVPNRIIREGITNATSFHVRNYFTKAIAESILSQEDVNMMIEILRGKHVDIFFSDMYVNSALASLMLVYLIKEMRDKLGFIIDNVTLQLDSPKRKCANSYFSEYSFINSNFENKDDADDYTDDLFEGVLGIDPEHSFEDADHHRWLRIINRDGGCVEIRPDHGISGGYRSDSKYMNLYSLNGNVMVTRIHHENVLYYVILDKGGK